MEESSNIIQGVIAEFSLEKHDITMYICKSYASCLISGLRLEIAKNSALLGCYSFLADAAVQPIGPILMDKESEKILDLKFQYSLTLRIGPIGCPETSAGNFHYTLRNNPEEHSSQNE
jgi:hypothetical protein